MTETRWQSLMSDTGLDLSESEFNAGWHWCDDFDGLLVGPGMEELAFCHCEVADNHRLTEG